MNRPEGDDTTRAQGDTSIANFPGHTKATPKINFLGTSAEAYNLTEQPAPGFPSLPSFPKNEDPISKQG